MVTSLWSGRRGFGSSNFPRDLSRVHSVISGCHDMPRIRCVKLVLSVGKCSWKFEIYYLKFYTSTKYKEMNYSLFVCFILILIYLLTAIGLTPGDS